MNGHAVGRGPTMPVRRLPWLPTLALAAVLGVSGCGGLSREEDDWCAAHLSDVKRAIPEERLRDYEYMDDTWKDACRHAFAQR